MRLILAVMAWLLVGTVFSAQAQGERSPAAEPPATASVALPEPSASARDLFSRYKDRLLQVRVLLSSASEQSSLGSGFVVRDDGPAGAWVLTNYHVISSLAIDPDKYRIELRGTNGRSVKARLMALDVIHDLAVLRVDATPDAPPWNVFKLREVPLTQGSKIFSLGNPLELGFLISEGIYNGMVESRVYDEMLFSGALNSGMSGGPAIDEQGQVVGVNVATRRDGEQLSFLVPVRYARDLLAVATGPQSGTPPGTPSGNDWRKTISQQLLSHQDFLTTKFFGAAAQTTSAAKTKSGFSTQTLAGRAVPTLDGGLTKCWANGLVGEKLRYQRDTLDCNLRSSLFVRGNLYTGTLSLQHVLLRNDKLAMPQFLSLETRRFQGAPHSRSGGELTAAECRGSYAQPGAQLGSQAGSRIYQVSICLRAYRKFAGIYDFDVSATQMDDASERQISRLRLNGFSFDNGQRLTRQFLERLQ